MPMTPQQITRLVDAEVGARPEALLDFLGALEGAADSTAMHAEADWQDRVLADNWDKIAYKIGELSAWIERHRPW